MQIQKQFADFLGVANELRSRIAESNPCGNGPDSLTDVLRTFEREFRWHWNNEFSSVNCEISTTDIDSVLTVHKTVLLVGEGICGCVLDAIISGTYVALVDPAL